MINENAVTEWLHDDDVSTIHHYTDSEIAHMVVIRLHKVVMAMKKKAVMKMRKV